MLNIFDYLSIFLDVNHMMSAVKGYASKKRKTPQTNNPQRLTPQRLTPQRLTPQRKTLQRKTLQRKTPRRKTPRRKTPQRKTLQRKTLQRKTLQRKTPQKKTPKSKSFQQMAKSPNNNLRSPQKRNTYPKISPKSKRTHKKTIHGGAQCSGIVPHISTTGPINSATLGQTWSYGAMLPTLTMPHGSLDSSVNALNSMYGPSYTDPMSVLRPYVPTI
jgi:penicillin-insensitive murein endopeptidase